MVIQVMGGGCSKCETLLENVKEAVAHTGKTAEIQYITDFAIIAGKGIMSTPALVINGKVVSSGRVLKTKEIESLLGRKMICVLGAGPNPELFGQGDVPKIQDGVYFLPFLLHS